jgi:hypothetical protein
MKNPLEKAEELVDTFRISLMKEDTQCGEEILCTTIAIQCAMIVVEEIIESRKDDKNFDDTFFAKSSTYYTPHPMYLTYWQEVKQELNKKQQDKS